MGTSSEKPIDNQTRVERRLRDEVYLLDPFYRKFFSYAIFDRTTNSLHGTRYSLHYMHGAVSIR